jgi:hypothetical protein
MVVQHLALVPVGVLKVSLSSASSCFNVKKPVACAGA